MKRDVSEPPIWAIGGGKGGVGKSLTALSLSSFMAMNGRAITLADGDLGGADLHTLLGIQRPRHGLRSFLDREVDSLEDALTETAVPRLRLLAGASDIVGLANPKYHHKTRLLKHLSRIETEALVLDLGAGTSFAVLDLYNSANVKVVVLTPDPTAIHDTYAFLKTALHRELKRTLAPGGKRAEPAVRAVVTAALEGNTTQRIGAIDELYSRLEPFGADYQDMAEDIVKRHRASLVINMADREEANRTAAGLTRVAERFLGISLCLAGHVERDQALARSVRQMTPYLLGHRGGPRWRDYQRIVDRIESQNS